MSTSAPRALGLSILLSILGCNFDAGGIGGAGGSSGTATTDVEPSSTTRGTTAGIGSTMEADETAATPDSTTATLDSTTTTPSDSTTTTVGMSSSSGGGELEQCNGVDDDDDGFVDEPSARNLACDDCTSVILDGVAFTTCTDEENWDEARARCMTLGGDLASFTDLEQQQAVVATASGNRWIGLTDTALEDDWIWVDGSAPAYTDWRASEPDNWGPGEDCAQIRGGDEGWGDARCSSQRDYVCEIVVE